jgi:hypothetical protein
MIISFQNFYHLKNDLLMIYHQRILNPLNF